MAETRRTMPTEDQIARTMADLVRTTTMLGNPLQNEWGPNEIQTPGTEYLGNLVEAAQQGYILGPNVPENLYPYTTLQLRNHGPAWNRLKNAIMKAQQEGRFA